MNPLCIVKGCDITLVLGWKVDDGGRDLGFWPQKPYTAGPFCRDHFQQWERMVYELPLAIQEFHALALITHVAGSESVNLPDMHFDHLDAASTRVRQLRELEAVLKGEPT